jgi:hypothetical protein
MEGQTGRRNRILIATHYVCTGIKTIIRGIIAEFPSVVKYSVQVKPFFGPTNQILQNNKRPPSKDSNASNVERVGSCFKVLYIDPLSGLKKHIYRQGWRRSDQGARA